MQTEYEAKFLSDHAGVREMLRQLGGACVQSEVLMRRVVYDHPQGIAGAWVRLRDEGSQVTLVIKQEASGDETIERVSEMGVVVDDFDAMRVMLTSFGLVEKGYQENKRENWELDGCEISLDTWPGVEPFVEIEGASEEVVRSVSDKLGFDRDAAIFGSLNALLTSVYGVDEEWIHQFPVITFDEPLRV